MNKKWQIGLGIIVSIVLLSFFLQGIDFEKVGKILKEAKLSFIFLSAVFLVLGQLLRAERWRVLVQPVKEVGLKSMFEITMIGMMSNNIFPARLGEFIKAYLLGYRENISKSTSLATVVVERLFDGLSITLFMILVILFFHFPEVESSSLLNPGSLWTICFVSSSFYIMVLLFLLFIKHREESLKRFFQVVVEKILPKKGKNLYNKLNGVISSFSEGLHFLHDKRVLIKTSLLSLLIWVLNGFSFYLVFPAVGIDLTFFTSILLTVVVAVAVMIPSSPGFVGTFHYSCQLVLVTMGTSVNLAASYAIIMHLTGYLPVTILGLYYVFKSPVSLSQLRHVEE